MSDPATANITMAGGDYPGAPQIAGARLIYHALMDRTQDQVTIAEVTFPVGQQPWFHIHHREDEGFYVMEGQLTVTIVDPDGQRVKMVVNEGELVWAPRGLAHTYRVSSDRPCRTMIILTPGNTLPEFFQRNEELVLDKTDRAAVDAFVKESIDLYGLEFFPEMELEW